MATKTQSKTSSWWESLKAGFKKRVEGDAKTVADAQSIINDAVAAKVEDRTPNHPGESILDALDELGWTLADFEGAVADKAETDRLLQLATVEKSNATRELQQVRAELAELERDHTEAEKQYRRDVGRLTGCKDQLLAKLSECSQAEATIKASASSTAKASHQSAIDAVGQCKRRAADAEQAIAEARRQEDHWRAEVDRFNGSFRNDTRADEARASLAQWTDEVDRLKTELCNIPNKLAALEQAAVNADRALVESVQ